MMSTTGIKSACLVRSSTVVPRLGRQHCRARFAHVVRASNEEQETFTNSEVSSVENASAVEQAQEPMTTVQMDNKSANPAASVSQGMTLTSAFEFDKAPEIINGRLAMIAFVAALGAELSSGESVLRQFGESSTGVILTAVLFSAASLIPMLKGVKKEAFGPLTPAAEMTNGRAAMLGFASLLVIEALRHKALF